MDKLLCNLIGTYRYGRFKYDVKRKMKKYYDNIGYIYSHLEELGVDKKTIHKIIEIIIEFPKLMTMNAPLLLLFITKYFI